MGRRSFVSVAAINRLISASRANEKRKYNEALIQANGSKQKELEPEYSINNVTFNEQTRATKIEFAKVVRYRTVERYVQQNYQRYPIYSDWKIKRSYITKNIKLTNSAIEELDQNADPLIKDFSFEIITWLKNDALYPSWYQKMCLEEDCKIKNSEQLNAKQEETKKLDATKAIAIETINQNNLLKKQVERKEIKTKKKISRVENKIEKFHKRKKNLLLSIITFSIYHYLRSPKRLTKLETKQTCLLELQSKQRDEINDLIEKNEKQTEIINQALALFEKRQAEIAATIALNIEEKDKMISEITPLPITYEQDNSFIPLKSMTGLEYKKIIGCYIIRNKQNLRCYVGQSKDVVKRIRQHFKGTYPNNIIFAEDYFAAKDIDKDNLFEVKIIPCTTKDELDRTEKELIEYYDAFNSGYNGTSGNS